MMVGDSMQGPLRIGPGMLRVNPSLSQTHELEFGIRVVQLVAVEGEHGHPEQGVLSVGMKPPLGVLPKMQHVMGADREDWLSLADTICEVFGRDRLAVVCLQCRNLLASCDCRDDADGIAPPPDVIE